MPKSWQARWQAAYLALEEKAQAGDALDFTEFNKRKDLTLLKPCTLDKFQKYHECQKMRYSCVLLNNRIVAVETRSARISMVFNSIFRKLFDLGRQDLWRQAFFCPYTYLYLMQRGCIRVNALGLRAKDVENIERPTHKHSNLPCERFIVDIGLCQTLPELHSYANDYFNHPESRVQIFLALKFYRKPEDSGRMVAVVFERGEDGTDAVSTRAVSFGQRELAPETLAWLSKKGIPVTGVGCGTGETCDGFGLPGYTLSFSTTKLFEGGALDAEGIKGMWGESFMLDLYEIQAAFLTTQESDATLYRI